MKKYSEEAEEYIKQNYIGRGPKEMAELLNKTFGTEYTRLQIKSYYGNNHLNSGVTGHFPKGYTPANKGKKGYYAPGIEKGWFQKGTCPKNHRSVGSECEGRDGYILVKVAEPEEWRPKHRVMWEEVHGPIPEGYALTFLDGNKQNIELNNMELISPGESAILNKCRLRSQVGELTKAGIKIARIKKLSKEKQKRR